MKINIQGNLLGTDGYSRHTRSLANALHEQGVDVRIEAKLPPQWERQVTDAELLMINKPKEEDRINIHISQPPFWRLSYSENPKHFVGFCVWEGDKIPQYWEEYINDPNVDQVWVPSYHVYQALQNRDEKVFIIPHGVDTSLFFPRPKKENRPFTFVCNKGWRGGMDDRGGVQYVLKAYCEEFSKSDNVRLIIKLNPAYLPPNFNFDEEMKKIGINKDENSPKILFNTSAVAYEGLPNFYNEGDIFVCATRAEGFNLPGLEAKAMGLPTIQTDFGGQTDYMEEGVDMFVKHKLEYVKNDIIYEEAKWAVPCVKDLRSKMRFAYDNSDHIKSLKDKCIAKAQEFTWTKTAKKAIEALKKLGK